MKEGEVKPSRELAALLENHLEEIPSLSPRKPSSRRAPSAPPTPPPPPMQPATNEHDIQGQRDLRTFLRVALSELLKEKRCSVFARPVDPENVPDYYDVVTSPMDLGNTRCQHAITHPNNSIFIILIPSFVYCPFLCSLVFSLFLSFFFTYLLTFPLSFPCSFVFFLSFSIETMRMKVDSNEYPTLAHFKRDLEQIVCNAQGYNPLTVKDQRGRAIVHAAHGMVRCILSKNYIAHSINTSCQHPLNIPC